MFITADVLYIYIFLFCFLSPDVSLYCSQMTSDKTISLWRWFFFTLATERNLWWSSFCQVISNHPATNHQRWFKSGVISLCSAHPAWHIMHKKKEHRRTICFQIAECCLKAVRFPTDDSRTYKFCTGAALDSVKTTEMFVSALHSKHVSLWKQNFKASFMSAIVILCDWSTNTDRRV